MVEVGGSWSWLLVSVVRCLLAFGELMCHRLSGCGLIPREPAGPWPFGPRHSDADGNGVDLFAALENRTGVSLPYGRETPRKDFQWPEPMRMRYRT